MEMALETAYKYKPSGQEGPKRDRRYAKPDSPLTKALEEFLNSFNTHRRRFSVKYYFNDGLQMAGYEMSVLANELLEDTDEITKVELETLLIPYGQHPNIKEVGIFLTAALNKSNLNEFVYEGEPIGGLGYALDPDKSLVIKSDTLNPTAKLSEGIVLNYATVDELGQDAKGPIVNYGTTDVVGADSHAVLINFGKCGELGHESFGQVINFGKVRYSHMRKQKNIVINVGDMPSDGMPWELLTYFDKERMQEMPKLKAYVDGLREALGPHQSYQDVLKELRQNDIQKDIGELMVEEGLK